MQMWILNMIIFVGLAVLVFIKQSVPGYLTLAFWYAIMGLNYYFSFKSLYGAVLWFIQFPKPLRLEITPLPPEVYVRISAMMVQFPTLRSSLIKVLESTELRKEVMTKLPYGYPKGMCNNVLRVCLNHELITRTQHSTFMVDSEIIEMLPEITSTEREYHV